MPPPPTPGCWPLSRPKYFPDLSLLASIFLCRSVGQGMHGIAARVVVRHRHGRPCAHGWTTSQCVCSPPTAMCARPYTRASFLPPRLRDAWCTRRRHASLLTPPTLSAEFTREKDLSPPPARMILAPPRRTPLVYSARGASLQSLVAFMVRRRVPVHSVETALERWETRQRSSRPREHTSASLPPMVLLLLMLPLLRFCAHSPPRPLLVCLDRCIGRISCVPAALQGVIADIAVRLFETADRSAFRGILFRPARQPPRGPTARGTCKIRRGSTSCHTVALLHCSSEPPFVKTVRFATVRVCY